MCEFPPPLFCTFLSGLNLMNETCLLQRPSSQFLYTRHPPQTGVKQSDPGVLSHVRRIFWLNLCEYYFIPRLQAES